MVKKSIRQGNNAALAVEKPIMEIIKTTNKTTFELSTDGGELILSLKIENNQKKTKLQLHNRTCSIPKNIQNPS